MYDFTIGLFESIVKHGLSWSTAAAVLFLILKQRAMKRKLKQYLPFMFKEEEVNPTYVSNQQQIMENQKLIMEALGVEPCNTKLTAGSLKPSIQTSYASLSISSKEETKRRMKMREYLKKLSRTKLQAFILATIMNIALLVGYVMDVQDIQSKVDEWMPMANMGVQTLLTFIYIWVEGGIDKAKVEKENADAPNYTDSGDAE